MYEPNRDAVAAQVETWLLTEDNDCPASTKAMFQNLRDLKLGTPYSPLCMWRGGEATSGHDAAGWPGVSASSHHDKGAGVHAEEAEMGGDGAGNGSDSTEKDEYVQCEKCEKWRLVEEGWQQLFLGKKQRTAKLEYISVSCKTLRRHCSEPDDWDNDTE